MRQRESIIALERLLACLGAQGLLVGGVACLAFEIQQERVAPAVLFPAAVGVALGIGESVIARLLIRPRRSAAVAVAALAGLLVVIGQDYIGHRYRLQRLSEQFARDARPDAEASPAIQPDFAAYLIGNIRREPFWWTVEAIVTSGTAAGTAAWALRRHAATPPTEPVSN